MKLIISIDDNHISLSPLSMSQLNPTTLNATHPAKHVAPDSGGFESHPWGLFINQQDRDCLVNALPLNTQFVKFLTDKVQNLGSHFRVFTDVRLNYLMPSENGESMQYLAYDKASHTHLKRPMEWVSVCLDITLDTSTPDIIDANLQTIFPLDAEHHVDAQETLDEPVFFIEILTPRYTERLVLSEKDLNQDNYCVNSSSIRPVKLWSDGEADHNIFRQRAYSETACDVHKKLISSFKCLPYPFLAPKNLDKIKYKIIESIKILLQNKAIPKVSEHLKNLQIDFTELGCATQCLINSDDEALNVEAILSSLKSEINKASKIAVEINQLAISTLSKKFFPQVSREDLIDIYQLIVDANIPKKEERRIHWKEHHFLIKQNKDFKKILGELKNKRVPDDKIIGKAFVKIRLFLEINKGVVLCQHPSIEFIAQAYRQWVTQAQEVTKLIQSLKEAEVESATIFKLLQENKAIQQRDLNPAQIMIVSYLKAPGLTIDSKLIASLLSHLEQRDETYAVTKLLDTQISVYAKTLKYAFTKSLVALIRQMANDNKNTLHPLFLRQLDHVNIAAFFTQDDKLGYACRRDIMQIPQRSHDEFCEIVEQSRRLIMGLNNWLVHTNQNKAPYNDLITKLAETLEEFYDLRRSHPYALSPFTEKDIKSTDRKTLLEIILSDLNLRLQCEQQYSLSLSLDKGAEKQQQALCDKRLAITEFLDNSHIRLLPLKESINILTVMAAQLQQAQNTTPSSEQDSGLSKTRALSSQSLFKTTSLSGQDFNCTPVDINSHLG